MEELQVYQVTPLDKSSIYTTEHWTNQLSNGKIVTVLYTLQFDDGVFNFEITDEEKEQLLQKDHIIVNDWNASTEEIQMGWDYEHKIQKEESYSAEEIEEIHNLMYVCNGYDNEDNDFNQDIMEENEWSMNDTIYEIYSKCESECIS